MGGKIVQLVQGKTKALEFENFEEWIERFSRFPLVQLVDLDAAMQHGDNRELIMYFLSRLPCQVGGGIQDVLTARRLISAGAKKIIVGSGLVRKGTVNTHFAKTLAASIGKDRVVCAIDSRHDRIAVAGWNVDTELKPDVMIRRLESICCGFLYTNIDTEGLLQGIPFGKVRRLRALTSAQLAVAGGITSHDEVNKLHAMGVDAVVGMAIYTGAMSV